MASKSPSSSAKNNGNNGKLSAAADLIRNLDAALVEMTNSAAKSADDAARARRNAKTAGEVARRYGKKNNSSAEKSLLEKKREKRAAARLAAEAKQRREHPRSSPVRKAAIGATSTFLDSPSKYRGDDNGEGSTLYYQFGDFTPRRAEENVQSNASEQFSSGLSRYNDDAPSREEQFNMDNQEREESSTQQTIMNDQTNLHTGYQVSNENDDENMEYYSQNMESYYDDDQQHQQPPSAVAEAAAPAVAEGMESTSPSQTRNPPISPRNQPTTSARLQASHAEDVLTLALELERTRSQLKAANAQLADVQSQNEDLQSQLLENDKISSSDQQQSTQSYALVVEELRMEKIRSKAAEEDAALALELAKDAQAVKEECEEWLTRSLDEIEFWKDKCLSMEKDVGMQHQLQQQSLEETGADDEHDNRKLVRFKEECPPSPVVSVEGGDAAAVDETEKRLPPPPEYSFHSTPKNDTWSTPQIAGNRRIIFTPNSAPTPSSKSAIANGRLYLHNASPTLSGELSPHPSIRASQLMKRSAETRRILRERLSSSGSGRLDKTGPSPPPSMAQVAAISAKNKGNAMNSNDTSHQGGVVYKTVANVLHESGNRLKLDGEKWTLTQDGLETMVKDYCGQVEGKIGQQKEKIDELTAFCDHLEVEFINSR
eukprot:CAMPEP_0201724862 /NCGR_PEP_ID=MMETSP0593-20130828/8450_1 /ASSEMBLY_ACC=CAM_ASM_000672 /TAXON_ID=267983 /ORGANISM="Skeletonema japonicum, Strain CCMP2506" /LENGTH=657 /DNA_ID=CAMNT_0048216165 /DNA_START=17 /DNA_END=1990 /DNA_ORIENTATION=-